MCAHVINIEDIESTDAASQLGPLAVHSGAARDATEVLHGKQSRNIICIPHVHNSTCTCVRHEHSGFDSSSSRWRR